MFEYSYNVALNGKFLFRTDRETDANRIQQTQIELAARFPAHDGFRITKSRYSVESSSHEINNGEQG